MSACKASYRLKRSGPKSLIFNIFFLVGLPCIYIYTFIFTASVLVTSEHTITLTLQLSGRLGQESRGPGFGSCFGQIVFIKWAHWTLVEPKNMWDDFRDSLKCIQSGFLSSTFRLNCLCEMGISLQKPMKRLSILAKSYFNQRLGD